MNGLTRIKRHKMTEVNKRSSISMLKSKSPVVEQYRTIRTNLQFSAVEKDIRSMIFTSANPGEGKSTTSINVAAVFAQQGKRILIIDADLRKPSVHMNLNIENFLGLTNIITKQNKLQEAIQSSIYPNLDVLTSGPIPPNPSELLGSNGMENVLEEAKMNYDLVILDTPPVNAVTDAQILANMTDGVVLVVSSGSTEIQQAKKAKELLHNANAKLLGAILNKKKQKYSDEYYYYGK
ncbi:CpsD/CapB family tyrosine-protein kinase [Peribacillus muralis]|uniref:CpsD/CapB family tyrosine-protein kinase n=1 Tax=Peribacillus muralis TaxID=264697 RepID=UPI00382F1CF0